VKCLLLLLIALSVPGQDKDKSVELAHLYVYPDSLSAEGVWRADNLNENTELAFDSVTRVECYKHGGRDLVDADAYCAQMTASVVVGMPDIDVEYFPVITWDRNKVIAADSSTDAFPVCFWTQITVNLQDHSIMATDTRKLSKGHEGLNDACKSAPLAQTYHLVEKIEELIRRKQRAARLDKEKSK
jgi:hypothetical protein